ncbi:MAG: bifunctional diaminohydroxyphosphoribosylaminopyrimidine deaminase/5-amino-6-(5-phosphoribosylamino)uracil reductase RibD [Spirochaetes bacterium]|nr:bifunctional diaminohydroxyphosphoribosylaminopyrimidine deaminase/5-amino-6-(5-phosphoribosylamino)uracil reductase RibD [Spirochaetota bacterium]
MKSILNSDCAQMISDDMYMKQACEIAFSKIGKTSPNPAVGAVIVKNGRIIGEGGTDIYGGDHAEIKAIKHAKSNGYDTTGAELYVSLEPCAHYGKTPPCTDAIIDCGITKVHIPILDPNPKVAGKGVEKLAAAGITVNIMNNYFDAASDLLRSFKKYILQGQPFIINKCAVTLDGRIASTTGDSKWISNEYTRLLVHKLRAKVDAIIIGCNTLIQDNPMLNARVNDFNSDIKAGLSESLNYINGRRNFFLTKLLTADIDDYNDPLRVLVGIPNELSPKSNFLRDDNHIIIANSDDVNTVLKLNNELKKVLHRVNIVQHEINSNDESIHFVMSVLKDRGVMTALLEGGGSLNGSFFNAGAIDQFMYIISPKLLGSGISPINGKESMNITDSRHLNGISTIQIKDNILFNGYKEEYNFKM